MWLKISCIFDTTKGHLLNLYLDISHILTQNRLDTGHVLKEDKLQDSIYLTRDIYKHRTNFETGDIFIGNIFRQRSYFDTSHILYML